MSWKNCVAVAGGAKTSFFVFVDEALAVPSLSPFENSFPSSVSSYTCITPAIISNACLPFFGNNSFGVISIFPVTHGVPLFGSISVSLTNKYSSRSAMQCSNIKHTSSHSEVSSSSGAKTRPYSYVTGCSARAPRELLRENEISGCVEIVSWNESLNARAVAEVTPFVWSTPGE